MILFSYILAFLLSNHSDLLFFSCPPGNSPIRFFEEADSNPYSSSAVCFFTIEEGSLTPDHPNCPGSATGSIVFNTGGIIGGSPPFSYDWDNINTQGNDVYPDDGDPIIDSIPSGQYQLIVTDNAGCIGTSSVMLIEPPPFVVTTTVDSITGCESSGGILINTYSGPPGIVNYNWDLASTPYDDDFGVGANTGLPPGENDAEDLITNALNGTYYLIISVRDNLANPTYECIYRDTFTIQGESVTEICPLGDISFYAGTSNPALTYQWQVDSVNGYLNLNNGVNYTGTTTPTLNILDAPSAWYGHKYRAKMMQGGNTTYSQEFILRFRVCWNGAVDMAWENANNWNCMTVPNANTDVFIPSNLPRYPNVNSNRLCRSVRLQPGARVDVKTPFRLLLLGD